MAARQKQTTNDKLAQNLVTDSLKVILRLLTLVGKPIYLLLTYFVLLMSFILYITGYFTRTIFSNLVRYVISLIYAIVISLPFTIYNKLLSYLRKAVEKRKKTRARKPKIIYKKRKSISDLNNIKPFLKKFRLLLFKVSNSTEAIINPLIHISRNLLRVATSVLISFRKLPSFTRSALSVFIKYVSKPAILIFNILDFIVVTAFKLVLFPFKSIVRAVAFAKKSVSRLNFIARIKLLLLNLRSGLSSTAVRISKVSKPKTIIAFFIAVFGIGMVSSYAFWTIVLKDLPSPRELTTRNVEVSTKIYDRNGILLYKIYKDENRTPVPLSEIPIQVRLATLAIEDAEFYNHIGFSIKGITRAVIKNIRKGELTGGSTITQQLIKNALLSSEKTLIRKLRELVLALQVELEYSKDEILEMYLNEVAYGGTAYGVQEASRMYFGKDVSKLTLGEAALLAGLPKSPTQFSPFGANPDAAIARQKEVIKLMKINGYITEKQKVEAEAEEITFAENKIDIKAPHFVMYVRDQLERKYGKEFVEQGGLEVVTTLDLRIQELAEQIVKDEVDKLSDLNVTNGAVVILSPPTGEVLAMVGSKDYFDLEADGNVNVTTSLRQPGSSIKIVNYAYILSNGFTPASIIVDSPITFLVHGQEPYTPRNYEGGFRGALTLRSAFAESRNVPAVKILNSYGVKNMIDQGRKMGITTWTNPDNYGLSLTLGGGEVRLIDLARVYATVANYGRIPILTSVTKITNHNGAIIEERKCEEIEEIPLIASVQASEAAQLINKPSLTSCDGKQVLDPRVAYLITDILKDNIARSPSFGTNSMLVIPEHAEVAVKTGTSNNLRDNLTVGYNQNFLVAAWVGNNDNSPMARVASGVTGASPIFNNIMSALLAQKENHDWDIPDGLVQLPICPLTGTLACTGCPVKMEWFLEENKPEVACHPDWFKKVEGEEKSDDKEKPVYQYFIQPSPTIKRSRFPIF